MVLNRIRLYWYMYHRYCPQSALHGLRANQPHLFCHSCTSHPLLLPHQDPPILLDSMHSSCMATLMDIYPSSGQHSTTPSAIPTNNTSLRSSEILIHSLFLSRWKTKRGKATNTGGLMGKFYVLTWSISYYVFVVIPLQKGTFLQWVDRFTSECKSIGVIPYRN